MKRKPLRVKVTLTVEVDRDAYDAAGIRMICWLLRLIRRPARPLSYSECTRTMRAMGMAGCEHPKEHPMRD